MSHATHARPLWDVRIVRGACVDAVRKLDPRAQVRNPVLFVVFVGSVFTTALWAQAVADPTRGDAPAAFVGAIALWLWFTVLFANFAEAMAEGRGKAQAAALRAARHDVVAHKVARPDPAAPASDVSARTLRRGDLVVVRAGDIVPGDGEIEVGVASVDESAITGESAPVIRESGGDRSAVTGGTRVLSDWLIVRITTDPGESFLDRMIALVEGSKRQKTPNEIALTILLAKFTIIFLLAVVTLQPFAHYPAREAGAGGPG